MVKGLLEDPVDRGLNLQRRYLVVIEGCPRGWSHDQKLSARKCVLHSTALQPDASTRTKDDIEKISHVYLDLDHEGTASLEALENSDLVPRANYVLDTSPGKFQVVGRWME